MFLAIREHAYSYLNNPSQITVGFDDDPFSNPICATAITDTGWHECSVPLSGNTISVHRTSVEDRNYAIQTLRSYSGINIAQFATVIDEPPDHLPTESASNLLWQYPRTNDLERKPYNIPEDDSATNNSITSCSRHTD